MPGFCFSNLVISTWLSIHSLQAKASFFIPFVLVEFFLKRLKGKVGFLGGING
jgi:hypothetical protein